MSFDLNKYLIPICRDTVYDESVMVVEDKDGFIPLQSLAYEALSILSVKNAELTKAIMKVWITLLRMESWKY